MTSPTDVLKNLLDLTEPGAQTHEIISVGHTPKVGPARVYGGQVLGQAVVAAQRTVADDRPIHSLHGYFLRPGDPQKPITYGVAELRDGRSFSARRVNAYQDGKPIISMSASFQTPGSGPLFQDTMPEGVPAPEDVPTLDEELAHIDHPLKDMVTKYRPFDLRYPGGSLYVQPAEPPERHLVWMKTRADLPDDPLLHRAALAFASDFTQVETALRRMGVSWVGLDRLGASYASLDHSMWWHRDARVDEWLLFDHHATTAQDGRSLIRSSVFNREGQLVASVVQEAMIRLPEDQEYPLA
ncbi:acyl-CoA thioesterase II [Pseudoglutamicibacter cumminsii]|uniref:acyl-CoA thioesterase n=1 Tax=Pseudoglutamicibacter cumminsii TaxID=156979 RepID=UPI0026EE6229|nr:acyl-CoA thioesterase II [Pseudoglutamicibacter cumminsii]